MLSLHALKTLAYYCFETVFSQLCDLTLISNFNVLNCFKFPIFVTWKSKDEVLRGCIGTVQEGNLGDSIQYFATESAFNDARFPPVTLEELTTLFCSVSILYSFELVSNFHDWQPGLHGLQLELALPTRTFSSIFLPEVCVEFAWSKSQTIDQLLSKAGVHWQLTSSQTSKLRITRFHSVKVGSDFPGFYSYWLDKLQHKLSQSHLNCNFPTIRFPH